MKKTIKPVPRQTLTDLAVIYFGKPEKAVDMAAQNDIKISDTPPETLPYSLLEIADKKTATFYKSALNLPATEITDDVMTDDGINFMEITLGTGTPRQGRFRVS